jgi:hypothetical protein
MKHWCYYVFAGVLVLATLPMYRYIFQRARALDHGPPAAFVQLQPESTRVAPGGVPTPKLWYAWNEKLPRGYRCSAADGIVYLTHIEKGSTVVEPLYRAGVMVRCGGDWRSSHR